MEDYFEIFRLNMKFYREQMKMSQSQLAIGADCTNGLIGQIEAGTTKPSFDRIINIAAALKIHPADLFLRNASSTVSKTKKILLTELLPQIEDFVEKRL
ncbi:MAG: helix-turn-helix transcriptional regulator [Treponema sp.]|nr:helix-turn-helix transcriptional regulator [Treponema sp.]MBR4384967.1 helix-turn-helix transcriptional regulator [Treponema sp.]